MVASMGVTLPSCYGARGLGAHLGAITLHLFVGNNKLVAICYLALLCMFSDIWRYYLCL